MIGDYLHRINIAESQMEQVESEQVVGLDCSWINKWFLWFIYFINNLNGK